MVLKNLLTEQQWRNRHREQTYGLGGGEGEMYGKSKMETYITICKIVDSHRNLLYVSGNSKGALYQPRGVGWGGRWKGVSKGRGYMYTYG